MLRTILRTLLWRPVTLLILPADSPKTWRLKLPAAALGAVLGIWAAGLLAATVLAGRHIHYEAMRLMNEHLAEEHEQMVQEVVKAEAVARRLEPMERELARVLARTRHSAELGQGSGGPEESFLPAEIPQRVAKLERAGDSLFREFQGLESLVAATPSGWPVHGWISSDYGERISPYTGEVGVMHQGVDIANRLGTPIHATADGIVLYAGWTTGGYGKMVEIVHGFGFSTIYGHCSRLRATPGQRVHKGDVIASVGATGNATGPHCHYEVRRFGVPVTPRPYMKE